MHPANVLRRLPVVLLPRDQWIAVATAAQAPWLAPGEAPVPVEPLAGDAMTAAGAMWAGAAELAARRHVSTRTEILRVESTGAPINLSRARPGATGGEMPPRGPGPVALHVRAAYAARRAGRTKLGARR